MNFIAARLRKTLTRISELFKGLWSVRSDDIEIVEEPDAVLEIVALGGQEPEAHHIPADKDRRRKQRNSMRRSLHTADAIRLIDKAWFKAWKFKRRDAHLADWPRIDLTWVVGESSGEERLFKRNNETVIDDGFDVATVTNWGSDARLIFGNSSVADRDNLFFFRATTSKMKGVNRNGLLMADNVRWYIHVAGVVVPDRGHGKPFGVWGEMAVSDGKNPVVLERTARGVKNYRADDTPDSMFALVMVAAATYGQRRFDWAIDVERGKSRFQLPIDRVGARELLFDRDKNGRARRPASLHWVKDFDRKNGSRVAAHMRGSRDFEWHGWDVHVSEGKTDILNNDMRVFPEFSKKRMLTAQ